MRILSTLLRILVSLCAVVALDTFAVTDPTVTGPIPATALLGDPSRNYPFLATVLFPPGSGYVEEEFFFSGTANVYDTTCAGISCPSLQPLATIVGAPHLYKARMIVRRPSDPARFNGKVIVEWQNVTNNWELDVQWYRAAEYFIREGYAWVGVGPQRAGVHGSPNGLRLWNPSRYGTLDVTDGGAVTNDALQWDIFSQAGQAILHPGTLDPLGNLPRQRVLIATGDSQSSIHLAAYINAVHPLDPIYAAFVLGGPVGTQISPNVQAKVLKVVSEWDLLQAEARNRRPDTNRYVSWEVAGASHSDYHNFLVNHIVRFRDVGVNGILPDASNCVDPARSRTKLYLVFHAAYDATALWLNGRQPPSMREGMVVLDSSTSPATVARDQYGIVEGGIRLADVDVPIALNNGWNTGGKGTTAAISCQQAGTYVPFTDATLATLYPTHASYVSKVIAATNKAVRDGFILKDDADTIIDEADRSSIGWNWNK